MPCVLIVEDDADLRMMMEYLLQVNGYETTCACNGLEAFAQIHLRKPCVVLLDLHMPVMDGFEFRRRQLTDSHCCAVPIVAITAHYDPQEVERQLGITCLHKPLSIDHVVHEVERACGETRG